MRLPQALVQPSERQLEVDNKIADFKLDLRHYFYKGQTQLITPVYIKGKPPILALPAEALLKSWWFRVEIMKCGA